MHFFCTYCTGFDIKQQIACKSQNLQAIIILHLSLILERTKRLPFYLSSASHSDYCTKSDSTEHQGKKGVSEGRNNADGILQHRSYAQIKRLTNKSID